MTADAEIHTGNRFEFGANWSHFLTLLDENRIADAENSLREMLGVAELRDRRFLDIGCGSGLFSLAARRRGAEVQ
jgi:2-polyprenyl-3-methyl-5-hydroxy-6-metoxy-1,4-benzoquinol methylase